MDWNLEFDKIMTHLEGKGVMPVKVPSLAPMEEALRRIGFYQSKLYKNIRSAPQKSIIVAGTNGKGSVCATLEKLLSTQGKTVGTYTSPHLMSATERIRFNEHDISNKDFSLSYASLIEKLSDLQLSHFETLTGVAVEYFMKTQPEYLIWEVGMGGLCDATNAISHGTCVITPISFDHENFLGRTIEEITSNKLGVVRRLENSSATIQVIHFPFPAKTRDLVQTVRKNIPSSWTEVTTRHFRVTGEPAWEIEVNGKYFPLALSGKRAVENSSIALETFKALGFSPYAGAAALAQVRWPGRMELLEYKSKKVFLSGDHNPQGMASLLEILKYYPHQHFKILFGIGREKNLSSVLPQLFDLQRAQVHLTVSPFKGLAIEDYGDFCNAAQWCEPHPLVALDRICDEASQNDLVLVTGSLYLVGQIRAKILEQR